MYLFHVATCVFQAKARIAILFGGVSRENGWGLRETFSQNLIYLHNVRFIGKVHFVVDTTFHFIIEMVPHLNPGYRQYKLVV